MHGCLEAEKKHTRCPELQCLEISSIKEALLVITPKIVDPGENTITVPSDGLERKCIFPLL